MKEIFYNLIKEAKDGKVTIDGETWNIGFNTIIYESNKIKYSSFAPSNLSTLVIKDEKKFLEKLNEYLMLELKNERKHPYFIQNKDLNLKKYLLTYLLVNATTEDFLNPITLIDRNIAFLKDNTFEYLNNGIELELKDIFNGSSLQIKNTKNSISMETPNSIEISFIKEKDSEVLKYPLPTVYYGITNTSKGKECYIYGLLNKKIKDQTEQQASYRKEISRKLYKVNKNVANKESNTDDYYQENITDVSPSAVISLVIFTALLKKEKIHNIKAISYLPLRYLSRSLAATRVLSESRKEELRERNKLIQTNITNKFIRTIRRAQFHITGMTLTSYPYELDEFVNISLDDSRLTTNNKLLDEVTNPINNKKA